MKEYISPRLIPIEFLNEIFDKMLSYSKGTVAEAFEECLETVLDKYEQELYECSYYLEGDINQIIRTLKNDDIINFSFKSVIKEAGKRCLRDSLKENIYNFLENYIEHRLYLQRFSSKAISSFPMQRACYYATPDITFSEIDERIQEVMNFVC